MANDDLDKVVEDMEQEEESKQIIQVSLEELSGANKRRLALRELIASRDISIDTKVYLIEDMIDRESY